MKKLITLLIIGGMFVFVTIQTASTKSNIDSLKASSVTKSENKQKQGSKIENESAKKINLTIEPQRTSSRKTIKEDFETDYLSTD